MKSAIKLTLGNNLTRSSAVVDASKTPKDLAIENGYDVNLGYWMLDGGALNPQEMNTAIGELVKGADTAALLQVVKASNA